MKKWPFLLVFLLLCTQQALALRDKSGKRVPETPLTPEDFAYAMTLITSADEAIHEIALPADVYRHVAHGDLRDVRIFNQGGQMIPFAIQTVVEQAQTRLEDVVLNYFPVSEQQEALPGGLSLSVRRDNQGTIINLDSAPDQNAAPDRKIVAYLVDASRVEKKIQALRLDWTKESPSFVKKITIEASRDLQSWSTVVTDVTIAEFDHLGHHIRKDVVSFPYAQTSRYYRLSWMDRLEPFTLTGVVAEVVENVPATAPKWSEAQTQVKGNDYLFETGGYFAIQWIHIALPQKNSMVEATLSSCDEPCRWRQQFSGMLYNLIQKGIEFTNPQIIPYGGPQPHWKLNVAKDGPPIGAGMPVMKFAWRPQRLVFLAQGQGPYLLAFGNKKAYPPQFDVTKLLARLDLPDTKLPQAVLGELTMPGKKGLETKEDAAKAALGKKIILWSVMLLSVGFLLLISVKLVKQINVEKKKK